MKIAANSLELTFLNELHLEIEPQAPLESCTTFQLGGRCRALIQCVSPQDVVKTIQKLNSHKMPFILIGGGSNLLVSDAGIDTYVIRYTSSTPLIERVANEIIVTASTELDALALFCVNEGLTGLNYTTGIPGTVGGAVIGNAGAWGKQVGDVLLSADIITLEGIQKTVGPEYFEFRYRDSRLKQTGDIILCVRFGLREGNSIELAQERAEILRLRADKHPNLRTQPCAGSFFRNVEPTSQAEKRQAAGWFLEQAGGKNLRSGGAVIFDKHANIIIKSDGCSAQNVLDLSNTMAQIVQEKFGIKLIREVRLVGKFAAPEPMNVQGFW